MHGVLRYHPAHGPGVELPELLPRLPPELHQEMGSIPSLTGRRCDPLNNISVTTLTDLCTMGLESAVWFCLDYIKNSHQDKWKFVFRLKLMLFSRFR